MQVTPLSSSQLFCTVVFEEKFTHVTSSAVPGKSGIVIPYPQRPIRRRLMRVVSEFRSYIRLYDLTSLIRGHPVDGTGKYEQVLGFCTGVFCKSRNALVGNNRKIGRFLNTRMKDWRNVTNKMCSFNFGNIATNWYCTEIYMLRRLPLSASSLEVYSSGLR